MTRWMPIVLATTILVVGCGPDQESPTVTSTPAEVATASVTSNTDMPDSSLGALVDPSAETMNQTAPAEFDVLFNTSAGDFTIHVTREWAPRGADRFYSLVKNKFYDGNRFFRVAPGQGSGRFVVQWGIHGNPEVNAAWLGASRAKIDDDPIQQSNTAGRITFATSGPNSRTTQLFINYGNNNFLDGMGFSPFGEVTNHGMQVVSAIYGDYGERPDQGRIQAQGNTYLANSFPNLDYIVTATISE